MNYQKRIDKIREFIQKEKTEAFLIKDTSNIFYLTGILEIAGFLIISKNNLDLFVPELFLYEARKKKKYNCINIHNSADFKKFLPTYKKISFISSELSYNLFNSLQKELNLSLIPTQNILKNIRMIKEKKEILLIKKALSINLKVFDKIEKKIDASVKETELAGEIHYLIRKFGGRKEAFEPVVASGLNSVYPHHKNSSKPIGKNQPVTIDAGTDYKGYKSDLTRTFFSGTPPKKLYDIFQILQETLNRTIEFVKPGQTGKEIHFFAVEFLKKKKMEKYFIHGLGHGVGIDVHEKPALNSVSNDIIQKGCVLTVEPGIYIPKLGGIRLEEMLII